MATITKFKGGKELQDYLNKLPAKIERNVMRSALLQGANVIKEAAKAELVKNGSVVSGDLSKSIRASTRSRRGQVTATLKAGDEKAFYAHMVEFGTAPHWISVDMAARPSRMTRRGKKAFSVSTLNNMSKAGSLVIGKNFVGQSVEHHGAKAKPFMRPALDANVDEAILAVGEQIRKVLSTKHGIDAPAGLEVDDD